MTQGVVVPYVHNQVAPGLGKIGVLVALESGASVDTLMALGKQIAMHVAAANPLALNADELSRLLSEAYQCTTLAATYIDKAAMGLLDPGAETPF